MGNQPVEYSNLNGGESKIKVEERRGSNAQASRNPRASKQNSQTNLPSGSKVGLLTQFKKLKKVENINDRYLFGKTLAKGPYSVFKLCKHKSSLKTCAVKMINK